MRADRLLTILALLEKNSQMTAAALAGTLGVTERTVYRDVQALCQAGFPVFTVSGPGGGIGLLPEYRQGLNYLTVDELQALVTMNIPTPLEKLALGNELKSALLKLSGIATRQRRLPRLNVFLDSSPWFSTEEDTPFLSVVQQAIAAGRRINLAYRSDFAAVVTLNAAPYGLVAKTNQWRLIAEAEGTLRVIRAAAIEQAELNAETYQIPAEFDLQLFWQRWCSAYEAARPQFTARMRVRSELLPHLAAISKGIPLLFSRTLQEDDTQWIEVQMSFESFEVARTQLLGLGGAVQVIAPLALRTSLLDFARQTLAAEALRTD